MMPDAHAPRARRESAEDETHLGDAEAGLTVGRTAELVGVSVRTLHHWDALGLVCPSARTWAGYRLYGRADIARLQQVLVYRELGMSLERIGGLLDGPRADIVGQLRDQHALLVDRIARLQSMAAAVEQMMEVEDMDKNLTPEQQAEVLGTDWNPEWHREAEQRWGDTEEWARSEARKAQMDRSDWDRVKQDAEALEADLAAAKRRGVAPGSAEANALAQRHRESIGQWFEATHAKHVLIARGYTEDPRFREHYDSREAGLAAWLREVIEADARANGVDPETAEWE